MFSTTKGFIPCGWCAWRMAARGIHEMRKIVPAQRKEKQSVEACLVGGTVEADKSHHPSESIIVHITQLNHGVGILEWLYSIYKSYVCLHGATDPVDDLDVLDVGWISMFVPLGQGKKEFAWMDSDDEASDGSAGTEEKAEQSSPKAEKSKSHVCKVARAGGKLFFGGTKWKWWFLTDCKPSSRIWILLQPLGAPLESKSLLWQSVFESPPLANLRKGDSEERRKDSDSEDGFKQPSSGEIVRKMTSQAFGTFPFRFLLALELERVRHVT